MSNVYMFALSGMNSAGRAYLHAARTISVDYQKPVAPTPQGYGPAPRDRVEIGSGQAQPQPTGYAPPAQASGGVSGGTAGGKLEAGVAQLLIAHQAFAANAKMLEAYAKTQQTLLDATA